MIDLKKIVHYKSVRKAVPSFLNEVPPPVVGYKYTRTTSSKIFNQKSVVKELRLVHNTFFAASRRVASRCVHK